MGKRGARPIGLLLPVLLMTLAPAPSLWAAGPHPAGQDDRAGISASWFPKAPMPIARAEVGVAAIDGSIYVIGGQAVGADGTPSWATTLNQVYDSATDQWQTRAPLPEKLSHPGVAALGGRLYVVGGFTDIIHMGPRPVAFVYDPDTDRWDRLPDISSARGSVAVAAVAGRLHIFGGRQQDRVEKIPGPPGAPELHAALGSVTLHQVFDPAKGKWTSAAPLPGPARDHAGIAVLGGKIHVFGGRIADVSDNLVRHDVYDPATDTWSAAAPLPVPRSAGAFTVLDGRILYAGGECRPGGAPGTPNAFDDATAYDPATDRWEALPPLPGARHAFGAATVGHTAYFAGGAQLCGGGFMTDMLALSFGGK